MGVSDRTQQQPQAPWRGGGPLVAPSGSTEVQEWVSEGKECEHQRICTPDVSGCHAASKHSRWWTARDWMASPSCPPGNMLEKEGGDRGEKEGWDTAGEKRRGGVGWRKRGEGSALRDPSQDQVTLRTRVAWQAGYSRDRQRKGGRKKNDKREVSRGRTGTDCYPLVLP